MPLEQTPCRSCGRTEMKKVLSLGMTPLADRLLTDKTLREEEPTFPLTVLFCPSCSLMQIAETVPAEKLFCEDYPYYSSFSPELLRHSKENADELIRERRLDERSLVVELASNDGYMLKNFKERGIPVLGIDPAEGPARTAQKEGIETLCTFFTTDLARRLHAEGKQADVIIANNVLAHVPDLNGFVEGINILLKDGGTTSIECPYVRNLIDHHEFDTIYHEHMCYYSVTALTHLFERHGLTINHIKLLPIHGGSMRIYAGKSPAVGESVRTLLEEEKALGMDCFDYYQDFADEVRTFKQDLTALLAGLKSEGKRIAAYGAAAKGATMINYVGIGPETLEFVVDRNTHKHGKYMPGRHIPIYPVEQLTRQMPDYVLILAWNFAEEIIAHNRDYLDRGGAFIVPIPTPRIVRSEEVVTS